MAKGRRTGGRKKGTPNKLTTAAREVFALAFDGAGGLTEFVKWAKANRTEFYKLYSKTIPLDVTSGGEKLPASQTIIIGGQTVQF